MTVQARIPRNLVVVRVNGRQVIGRCRVPSGNVATLTEEGQSRDEHLLVVRPVRVMTIQAVLTNRRMFKKEGSALVRMAGVAGLSDGSPNEHFGGVTPVRVMAGCAVHFSFFDGHMRIAVDLGDDVLMALSADLLYARLH